MLDTSKPLIKVTYENKEYTLGGAGTKFGELVGGTIEQVESSDLQNVTTIKSGAFENSANLKTAEIPSNVTSIGDNAFSGCSNLTSLTIDEGVETIGANAFNGINSEVTLPSTLTSVGEGAFANNSAITSIDIPASLTALPENMLSGCDNLTDVNMEATTPPSVTSTTFPQSANINVSYGSYDDYVGSWGDYTDTITRLPAKPSTIIVTVNNYLGELVSGASITISGSNGETYAGTTDSAGVFTQGDLQPATYTISVADLEGFKTPESLQVVVAEDTQNSVTVTYLEKPAVNPVFGQNTPEQIDMVSAEISAKNMTSEQVASTYGWNIGDTIDMTLTDNTILTWRIVAFNHYNKSDGSGKAGISFEMTQTYLAARWNYGDGTYGGYETSRHRTVDINGGLGLAPLVPSEWTSVIKFVNVNSSNGGGTKYTKMNTLSDQFYALSVIEVGGEPTIAAGGDLEGSTYEYYLTDADVKRKKTRKVTGASGSWLLRSCANDNTTQCTYVEGNGSVYTVNAGWNTTVGLPQCSAGFSI